jgi:DNA invertase Pin-like site-specific DNA recombinase
LTGTNRARPGLREALAACRSGDTLVVTKLDRLARSLPDARDIVDELTTRQVKLNLGGSIHDPNDPVGRLLFNVLAMVAEFESDLIKMRTREGLAVARAAGKLRGRKPKLSPHQRSASRGPPPRGREEPGRVGGAIRRRPVHGLPSNRTRRRSSARVSGVYVAPGGHAATYQVISIRALLVTWCHVP